MSKLELGNPLSDSTRLSGSLTEAIIFRLHFRSESEISFLSRKYHAQRLSVLFILTAWSIISDTTTTTTIQYVHLALYLAYAYQRKQTQRPFKGNQTRTSSERNKKKTNERTREGEKDGNNHKIEIKILNKMP